MKTVVIYHSQDLDGYLCNPKTCNMRIEYKGAAGFRLTLEQFNQLISK